MEECSFNVTWENIKEEFDLFWNKKIDSYIKAVKQGNNSRFSWVSSGKDEYTGHLKTFEKRVKPSMKWFIPTQITGNPETATFYLCLFNPRIPDKKLIDSDFKSDILGYQSLDFCSDDIHEQISKFIYNKNQTVLQSEFSSEDEIKYYWTTYYRHIFDNTGTQLTEEYSSWPICDLEYVPYVSENKGEIPTIKKSLSRDIVAKKIIRRVVDYLNTGRDKPVFVFRSLKEYKEILTDVLKDNPVEFKNKKYDSIISFQKMLVEEKGENLFYTFSGQNASLGINSLVKLNSEMEKDGKLDKTSYKKLIDEQLLGKNHDD